MGIYFKPLILIFNQESISDSSQKLKKTIYIFVKIQFLLQNINFFWQPDLPIQNWNKYQTFWVFLNFPCIDSLAANYQISNFFMFYVISNLSAVIVLFHILALCQYYEKGFPNILLLIMKLCFEFLYNLYFIPSCISLITLVKYSSSSYEYLQEYTNVVPGSMLNYGTSGQIIGIVLIFIHLSLMIVYESCSYDMRHSLTNNFYSKTTARMNIIIKLFCFIQCCLFSSFQLMNYELYMELATLSYFGIVILVYYYLPYHSFFTNAVELWLATDSAFTISFFLLGI